MDTSNEPAATAHSAEGARELPVTQLASIAADAADVEAAVQDNRVPLSKVSKRHLLALFIAQSTLFMALVVPSAFSLAIKIGALDPSGRDTMLPLAIGVGATLVIFTNPVFGVLSDRTLSRWGRRRPWMIFSMVVGLLGSLVVAFAGSSVVVIVGWAIAMVGYAAGSQAIFIYLGDRLPESQRGKVMGISGAITQIGPIAGILIAGSLSTELALVFIVPAVIAFLGSIWFVLSMHDPQHNGQIPPFRIAGLLRGFYINPRKHQPFAWVLVSKFFIFACIAFNGVYGVYLLTSELGVGVTEAAGVIATISLVGIFTAIVGAVGSGWLSDKLRSRKPFLVISGLLMAVSAVMTALACNVTQFIVAGIVGTFAIGVYGAVDQALALDALPKEEGQNGRFLAVFGLANSIPQAVGPFLAGAVLALASGEYRAVWWAAAVFAVLGALTVIPIKVARPPVRVSTETAGVAPTS
ncbi:MFS transporter [Microbacterium rhizomatis]|uniref:MFS transporter n=1 Tax=Microbacterium rhizomatis TaxID=1631477 RepID=A0A5J5IZ01_9MICO|nr:MFS transporter [Microbacterium rhizomatis]